ncbi:hypothetical protein H310_02171 [Aphanomyces invadans]|uniref:PHD-type domain-containing protein n=1 Tax=Aphanomyces invadans TaxID=157072 RepID=A0A024UN41_9STRA|nr:hypothetical protein H310_02171 [Aphanomyces invadans]ETW07724.1 hypothetical protein H310_02171 [Aphanomyces invadans]|eukprot:XP_008863817.1 hypothetical protein H310_02171 [Aphanomyces invadans]
MPTSEVDGTLPPGAAAGDDGQSLDVTVGSQTTLRDSSDYPANRVCMVCFDGAEYATNPLLCCSVPTCRMRVHLACYGSGTELKPLMPYKRRSTWVCDACAIEKQHGAEPTLNAQRTCVVCKLPGGALKPTKTDNAMCHLVCVRWLPELKQVPSELHPTASVVDADLLYGTRKSLKCHICQKRNGCLQCMVKRCTKAFHAVCALRAPETKVYTGITEANHLACICDAHFAEVRATFRSIKDEYWDQPYIGEEIDDVIDDGDASDTGQSRPPTPLNAPPSSMLTQPPLPTMLAPVAHFVKPPTPNKVGRPRKNPLPSQDPSAPKPMLPPPPGSTQAPLPFVPPPPPMMSTVGRPRPLTPQTYPSPHPPHSMTVSSKPSDVAVCTWCMQPMLSSMLQVHQQSMCQSRPSQRNSTSKDSNQPKKTRGRPPGPTSKTNKDRPLLQPQEAPAKKADGPSGPKTGMKLQPSPLIASAGPFPRPMMTMQPRPMASHPMATIPRPPDGHPTPPPQPVKDILMENALGLLRLNSVDPLFASWPSMLGGGLLQSRDFWTQVLQAFFSKPGLTPPKWNPITQWLAGVSCQAFLQPLKPPTKCSDVTTFTQISSEWLAATDVRHTCDAMLQSHGVRCAQPLTPFTHIKSLTRESETSGILEVVLASHNRPLLHCRFAVVCAVHAPTNSDAPNVVWSRFRPNNALVSMPNDAESTILSSTTAPAVSPQQPPHKELPIWIALLSSEETTDVTVSDMYDSAAVHVTNAPVKDDMALESMLCWDLLQEQLKVNRMRMQSLWRKANAASASDATAAAKHVESLYEEYNWWKSVCTSMMKGTNDMPFLDDPDGNLTGDLQSFEDGTCVVCMDGYSEDSNPIIFCDKCDVAVHQRCYGVATIPKSDFYCDKCSAKGPVVPQCALCPHPHGALKQTVEGLWVHVFCALWCPTTFLVKVPRMLFQLTPDLSKVRYATTSIDELGSTTALADVVGLPPPVQRGGLCRVCRIATGCTIQCRNCPASFHPLCAWFAGCYMHVQVAACGYVCAGGGQGLLYTLTCLDHTPPALPCQDRHLQRCQREQLYKSTTRNRCAVCFEPMPTMYPQHRFDALPSTHFFLRCTVCHVQCHAHCAHPIDAVDSRTPTATWQCEKCVAPGSPAEQPAAVSCLLCDLPQGYMLPAHIPSEARTATAAGGLAVSPPPVHPYVHLYCARAFQQSIQKTSKQGRVVMITAAAAHVIPLPSHKCVVCHAKSPATRLVTCWKKQCSVLFHPYCSATSLWFSWKPTPKAKTLYCCSEHPPGFAAFDAARQVWVTRDTLMALQEIRCSLERVRMFINLSKQREKAKKRLFVQSDSRAFDKVMEFLHVKAPTKIMKEFYHSVTNTRLADVPKRKLPDELVMPSKVARTESPTPTKAALLTEAPSRSKMQKRHQHEATRQRYRRFLEDSRDDAEEESDEENVQDYLARMATFWSQPVEGEDHPSMDDVMAALYPHHVAADAL